MILWGTFARLAGVFFFPHSVSKAAGQTDFFRSFFFFVWLCFGTTEDTGVCVCVCRFWLHMDGVRIREEEKGRDLQWAEVGYTQRTYLAYVLSLFFLIHSTALPPPPISRQRWGTQAYVLSVFLTHSTAPPPPPFCPHRYHIWHSVYFNVHTCCIHTQTTASFSLFFCLFFALMSPLVWCIQPLCARARPLCLVPWFPLS